MFLCQHYENCTWHAIKRKIYNNILSNLNIIEESLFLLIVTSKLQVNRSNNYNTIKFRFIGIDTRESSRFTWDTVRINYHFLMDNFTSIKRIELIILRPGKRNYIWTIYNKSQIYKITINHVLIMQYFECQY